MKHFYYLWMNGLWVYYMLLLLMFAFSFARTFLVSFLIERYYKKRYLIHGLKWRLTFASIIAEILVYVFFCAVFFSNIQESTTDANYLFAFGGTMLNTLTLQSTNYYATLLFFVIGFILWLVVCTLTTILFAKASIQDMPKKRSKILILCFCTFGNIPIYFIIQLDGLIRYYFDVMQSPYLLS